MAALGLDEHHAIASLSTIEGRGILENGDLLDVLGIDVEQQVGVIAVVEGVTRLLQILHHTVDHDEGLRIGRQRVESSDEHRGTIAGATTACDAAHIGTQLVLDVGLHGL